MPGPAMFRRQRRKSAALADARSALLELLGCELMPCEELVEVGAVAPCETRRLTDIAAGNLQDLGQITAHELIARLIEGGQTSRGAAEGLLYQLDRDDRRL